jgi:hypothetical protein
VKYQSTVERLASGSVSLFGLPFAHFSDGYRCEAFALGFQVAGELLLTTLHDLLGSTLRHWLWT